MEFDVTQDDSTVTPEGKLKLELIDGVYILRANTHVDERGTFTEVQNVHWDISKEPVVQVNLVTIRPGKVKGWVLHKKQTDRLFLAFGSIKIVLFDAREDSPTYRKVNEIFLGENNRAQLYIPPYVFHAIQNVGHDDCAIIECPTVLYDYDHPDKFRLPPNTSEIPYTFTDTLGR